MTSVRIQRWPASRSCRACQAIWQWNGGIPNGTVAVWICSFKACAYHAGRQYADEVRRQQQGPHAADGPLRYKALEWLHWHNGGLGPMSQHLVYFLWKWQNQLPAGTQRVADELNRLLDVIDTRLSGVPWLAGDDYTIADIINYPWIAAGVTSFAHVLGDLLRSRPHLRRWLGAVGQRPAVRRGMQVPNAGRA